MLTFSAKKLNCKFAFSGKLKCHLCVIIVNLFALEISTVGSNLFARAKVQFHQPRASSAGVAHIGGSLYRDMDNDVARGTLVKLKYIPDEEHHMERIGQERVERVARIYASN